VLDSYNKIDTNIMEKSITIHIVNATGHSTLEIKLPRNLIDSKSDQGDTSFTVLADNTQETQYMQSVNFHETQTHSDSRTLLIDLPFHPYSTDGNWYVKIIGTRMNLENKNPPVMIPQVELDDQYVTIPEGISCMQWNKMADQRLVPYYCTENIVPNEAVECGYSMIYQHVCNPVHKTYNFTNACTFYSGFRSDGTPIIEKYANGDQWISLYNTKDNTVNISDFNMKWYSPGFHENYDSNFSLMLFPHEDCTVAGYFVDPTTATALIQYKYQGNNYVFKTPPLTDLENDTRTWQYDGNKWTFAEQNTVTVPEFPIAIPILLIGIVSAITFYRIKSRK
jgi:hypothetical protein